MPIEIRELVIKAVINETAQQGESAAEETASGEEFHVNREEIVQEILELLNEIRNER